MMGSPSLITRDNAKIFMTNSLIYGSKLVISSAASWCLTEVAREALNKFASLNLLRLEGEYTPIAAVPSGIDIPPLILNDTTSTETAAPNEKKTTSFTRTYKGGHTHIGNPQDVKDIKKTQSFNMWVGNLTFIVCSYFVNSYFETKTPYKYIQFTQLTWKKVFASTVIFGAIYITVKKCINVFSKTKFFENNKDNYIYSVSPLRTTINLVEMCTDSVFWGAIYSGSGQDNLSKAFGIIPAQRFIPILPIVSVLLIDSYVKNPPILQQA